MVLSAATALGTSTCIRVIACLYYTQTSGASRFNSGDMLGRFEALGPRLCRILDMNFCEKISSPYSGE